MIKFYIISIVAIFLLLPDVAYADENTIVVSPAILEIAANPGENITRPITIQNDGAQSLPVSFEAQAIIRSSQVSVTQRDASSWISFPDDVVVFEKQQRAQIPVSIAIPENAEAGGHYAQISVRGLSLEPVSEQASSIVIPEVTISVLITINGEITESITFKKVDLMPWQASPESEQMLTFTIENTGNVHNIISPEFVLLRDSIEDITKLGSQIILPGEEVEINQSWRAPSDYGEYTASVRTNYGNDNLVYTTEVERMLVTPKITTLATLAIIIWLLMYYVRNKDNILLASKVLITGKK